MGRRRVARRADIMGIVGVWVGGVRSRRVFVLVCARACVSWICACFVKIFGVRNGVIGALAEYGHKFRSGSDLGQEGKMLHYSYI
jgi:hypothetical protein